MIDSHTHLFLCEAPTRPSWSRRPRAAGVERMLDRRPRRGDEPRRRSPPPSATRRSSPRSAATPTTPTGFDDAAAARDRRARRPREGAGDRRDRPRLLPRHRRRRRPAARLRRPRSRSPVELGPADRDPRPRPRGRERGDRRDLRHARRRGAGGHTVILHCFSAPQRVADAAERGWYCSFAGNVTYPQRRRRCARRRRRCPRSGSWSRPTRPTSRPQAMRGKRNQPANVVATAERPRRGARRHLRGAGAHGRGQRRARSSAGSAAVVRLGQNFLADPNLLDAIVRDAGARRRTTSCSRSAPGKGC